MSKRSGDLDFAVDCALQGGRCVCGFIDHCISAQGIGFYIDRSGCREQDGEPDRHTVGRISGGALMTRMGLYGSLMLFGIFQAVSNLSFWALSLIEPNIWAMGSAVFVENLCGGMGTAAFVGLLTSLCSKEFSATQYALLSSLAAMGRVYLAAPCRVCGGSLWMERLFCVLNRGCHSRTGGALSASIEHPETGEVNSCAISEKHG